MEVQENPLSNMTAEKVMGLMGTNIRGPVGGFQTPDVMDGTDKEFDSRKKWGACVHPIRNQAQCGSCWAFGASEALSDRFCIAGGVKDVLSAQDLVSCDSGNMACQGGWLDVAWQYLQNTGIAKDSCIPYTSGAGQVAQCPSKCDDGSAITKFKCAPNSVVEATTSDQIKSQIQTYGPMETSFTVYQDFFSYKSGVYQHVTGGVAGGHAVKMLGWGVDGNTEYWLCANSWGNGWGDSGFFKIKKGDCGIDNAVYGCTPELRSASFF